MSYFIRYYGNPDGKWQYYSNEATVKSLERSQRLMFHKLGSTDLDDL